MSKEILAIPEHLTAEMLELFQAALAEHEWSEEMRAGLEQWCDDHAEPPSPRVLVCVGTKVSFAVGRFDGMLLAARVAAANQE